MTGSQRAEIKTVVRTTQKRGWCVFFFFFFLHFFLQHWTCSIVASSVTKVAMSLTSEKEDCWGKIVRCSIMCQRFALCSTSGVGEQACPTNCYMQFLIQDTWLIASSKLECFPDLGWKEWVAKQCPNPTLKYSSLNKTLFADLVCACTFDVSMTNFFFFLSLPKHFPHGLADEAFIARSAKQVVTVEKSAPKPGLVLVSFLRLLAGSEAIGTERCLSTSQDPTTQSCLLCFLLLAAEMSHLVYLYTISILPAGETAKNLGQHL